MRCDAMPLVTWQTGLMESPGHVVSRWDGWVGYGTSRKAEFGELVVLVVFIADVAV